MKRKVDVKEEKMVIDESSAVKETLSIPQIFCENKFNRFVAYCEAKGINSIEQLERFDLNILYAVAGIGEKKISDIRKRLEDIKNGEFQVANKKNSIYMVKKNNFKMNLDRSLKDADVSVLAIFGLKRKIIQKLNAVGIFTLSQLENLPLGYIAKTIGKNNLNKLTSLVPYMQNDYKWLLERTLIKLKDYEGYGMMLSRSVGMTLKEIGESRNITRERIRQIIKHFSLGLSPIMEVTVSKLFEEKPYITLSDIRKLVPNENDYKVVLQWCKYSGALYYMDFAGVFVSNGNEGSKELIRFEQMIESEISEGINLMPNSHQIEDMLDRYNFPYLNEERLLAYLKNNGYKVYSDIIVKGRKSYGYLCAKLVAKYFPHGIKLYDSKELAKLREYMKKEHPDVELARDDKALSVRLFEYTVLCDRGMVIAKENVHISKTLLQKIKRYIDQLPEIEVYYSLVFAHFKDELLKESNVNNYHFLHGVIKLYFKDDYDFSSRDYLKKQGSGLISSNMSSKIKNLIRQRRSPVYRDELLDEITGLSITGLSNTISSDNDIIQLDYNLYYDINLFNIEPSDVKRLRKIINDNLKYNNGYMSSMLLYHIASKRMSDFLVNKNIRNASALYSIASSLFGNEYDFRRPHITTKGLLEKISIKEVFYHLLGNPEVLYYGDFQTLVQKQKWSAVTKSTIFAYIQEDYVRVEQRKYVRRDKLKFSNEFLHNLEKEIDKQMTNGYFSLIGYNAFDTLPQLDNGYKWNVYILRSIIAELPKYKMIESKFKDRRYERGIVVDETSAINSYELIVLYILKLNNIFAINEKKLLALLLENRLAYKALPKELYSSKLILYKNGVFYV